MATYDTPGAYIEREDRAPGGISRLRTDIAAFVGIAERGPARRAVAIESWKQFTAIFGGLFEQGYLGYVVKAFFENGGRRCWVVRVEGEAALIAGTVLRADDAANTPVWSVQANSSGAWGNGLSVRLLEIRRVTRRSIKATVDWAQTDSIAGFTRAGTVELIQQSGGTVRREQRVLSAVDASRSRLIWNNSEAALRLASDAPLAAIDPVLPFRIETVAYQLQVAWNGLPWRVYDDLALAPDHPRYGPKIANGVAGLFTANASQPLLKESGIGTTAELVAFGKRGRSGAVIEPIRLIELRAAPRSTVLKLVAMNNATMLTGGFDGLSSLTAEDFIGAETDLDDSDAAVLANRCGIAALGEIDEISLVAVPDIHIQPRIVETVTPPRCQPNPCLPAETTIPASPAAVIHGDLPPRFPESAVERVMAALVLHCESRRDRVALIDPPFEASTRDRLGVGAVRDFRRLFDSTYAALYFPWLEVLEQLPHARQPTVVIPPSGHIAGQIAATDLRIGVHKAPANVPLTMAERATFAIDEATHGLLNLDGINVIRAIPGRGLRIAGARLMSSNTNLRFLNVRRFLLMIERSMETALQWAVFEGNDWLTRAKLALTTDSFLRALWSRGALMGSKAEEAFYVRCDDTNNPADTRDRGELLIEVGVAPSVPFEFVVLRIGRVANGLEITEPTLEGG
jgi:phage tail sheath protein FI